MSSQHHLPASQAAQRARGWNARDVKEDPQRWIFPPDKNGTPFQNPSLPSDVDEKSEQDSRRRCAELINTIGRKLSLAPMCVNTAILYMHRFYQFHSMNSFHPDTMAPAFVFLAAKVDDCLRRVEDVIRVTHKLLNPAVELRPDTPKYQQELDDIFAHENVLLQTLAFDLTVEQPHPVVIKCCQDLRCEKPLSIAAYAIANCTLQYTSLCVKYPPAVIAAMCIFMASQWSKIAIPPSMEGKAWYACIDAALTLDLIHQVANKFLDTVEKYPEPVLGRIRKEVLEKAQGVPTSGPAGSGSRGHVSRTETGVVVASTAGSAAVAAASIKVKPPAQAQAPPANRIKPPVPPIGHPPVAPPPPSAFGSNASGANAGNWPAQKPSNSSAAALTKDVRPSSGSNATNGARGDASQPGSMTVTPQRNGKRTPEVAGFSSVEMFMTGSLDVASLRMDSSKSGFSVSQKRVLESTVEVERNSQHLTFDFNDSTCLEVGLTESDGCSSQESVKRSSVDDCLLGESGSSQSKILKLDT